MVQKLSKFFGCGFVMGTADVIPGVSGGTMAWVLGIYERLVNVVASFGLGLLPLLAKRDWRALAAKTDLLFILPLFAGILASIVVMVKLIGLPSLMRAHPEPVYGLFFGLIIGSVWLLMRQPVRLPFKYIYWLIGALLGFAVVNLVPTATPDSALILLLCGALAISAMLLPGISGSFILLILGKYTVVLSAISALDFSILLPFMAGCLVGLMAFSRLLKWLMAQFHDAMLWLMAGLLTGTLWMIWPFQERVFATVRGKEKLLSSSPIMPAHWDTEALLALALSVLGFAVVVGLERVKHKA